MLDRFNRKISYLRVSVTDRCNLRCTYCMPEEGIELKNHKDILSFEDIARIVSAATRLGIGKIRLTGGEPLVRRGIVNLVSLLSNIDGVDELAMTTNGTLLGPLASALKEAGLHRINVSLDTLDATEYRRITRGGAIENALDGITAALAAGLPVKINMVIPQDSRSQDVTRMREFCTGRGMKLQLIRQYTLSEDKTDNQAYDRPSPCAECNRIRLLADGTLKPCLHSDGEIPLDLEDIEAGLIGAIRAKPARGTVCTGRDIVEIGG